MKYFILFIISCSITTTSFSQNWALVNANRTVFFQHSDSSNINNIIEIDSIEINGLDTLLFTGRIVEVDTTNNSKILKYAYDFFGAEILNNQINNQFEFDNKTIKHLSSLSATWPFTSSITAQTVSIVESIVFGQIDSIKTIVLTGSDTIILSKNHGILRYPDFNNTGAYFEMVGYHEGQNSFGIYLPNFWTIYNFNIGDVFCYESYYGYNNGNGVIENKYKIRLEVLENLSADDTIKYVMRKLGTGVIGCSDLNQNSPPCYNAYYNSNDTLDITFHKGLLESGFGLRNFVGIGAQSDISFYDPPLFNNINSYSIAPTNYWSMGYHRIQTIFGEGKEILFYSEHNDSLLKIDQVTEKAKFVSGYGITEMTNGGFTIIYTKLVGAIKASDTIGLIYNFSDDLAIDEVQFNSEFLIYPNPTSSSFSISTQFNYLRIKVTNLQGKTVMQSQKQATYQIDHLESGIYIVSIYGENDVYSKKIVVE